MTDFEGMDREIEELIPPQCLSCPVQYADSVALFILQVDKAAMTERAHVLMEHEDNGYTEDDAAAGDSQGMNAFVKGLRVNTATSLDQIDSQITASSTEIIATSEGCYGTAEIEVTIRDVSYALLFCTSSHVYRSGILQNLPVFIRASKGGE